MPCPPGVPCNDIRKPFPLANGSSSNPLANRNTDCDKSCIVESVRVAYDGPNLPQSGINTGDCLTLCLEKLDNAILRYSNYYNSNAEVITLIQALTETVQQLAQRVTELEAQ